MYSVSTQSFIKVVYIFLSITFITFINTRFTQHPIEKELRSLTNIYIYFTPIKLSKEYSVKGGPSSWSFFLVQENT